MTFYIFPYIRNVIIPARNMFAEVAFAQEIPQLSNKPGFHHRQVDITWNILSNSFPGFPLRRGETVGLVVGAWLTPVIRRMMVNGFGESSPNGLNSGNAGL